MFVMFYLFPYFNINNTKKVINSNYTQTYRNLPQTIFILILKWKNSCTFMKPSTLNTHLYHHLHKSAEKSSLDVLAFFHLSDEKNLAPIGPSSCTMYK